MNGAVKTAVVSLLIGITVACARTEVRQDHSLLQENANSPAAATVYFMRNITERAMGHPDNLLPVELNDELLMKLGKGEYTLVQLVPRDYIVTLRNLTEKGPDWKVSEMVRRYQFQFEPGNTHYVLIEPLDGEFRGVYFTAREIDAATAKAVAQRLRAVGPARAHPPG